MSGTQDLVPPEAVDQDGLDGLDGLGDWSRGWAVTHLWHTSTSCHLAALIVTIIVITSVSIPGVITGRYLTIVAIVAGILIVILVTILIVTVVVVILDVARVSGVIVVQVSTRGV